MSKSAHPRLCQEIYKLTHWKTGRWHGSEGGLQYPKYDTEFLLRHVGPGVSLHVTRKGYSCRRTDSKDYGTKQISHFSHFPANALAMMVIDLLKRGYKL